MLVTAAQPSNVDTVVVDGRILKRNGRLTHLNSDQIVREAGVALAAVRKRGDGGEAEGPALCLASPSKLCNHCVGKRPKS